MGSVAEAPDFTSSARLKQGRVDLDALVARIREAFPDLAFDRASLNDLGEDHAVVVLDEAWVFRFPRTAAAAAHGIAERRVLAGLGEGSPLATPRYERVSPAGDVAGYRMIGGAPLTEALFASLPRRVQDGLLEALGEFLACLHRLSTALAVRPDGSLGPTHDAADFARRFARRRARFASAPPDDLVIRLDRFFAALPDAIAAAPQRLVHGDLTEDHILLAPDGEHLAGVIDFTDAGAGDPAFDFTFLWAYGEGAPHRVAGAYGGGDAAAKLLERSRWWFVRYSVDRIWWDLTGARACDAAKVLGDIRCSLDALGF
jgi:aminoglycoside 2''-phosphotransferase